MVEKDETQTPVPARRPFTFASREPTFERVRPLLAPALEITRDMLRLLNMVDETIIVHDPK